MATATRQQKQQQRPRGWWFRRRRSSAWLVLVLSGLATIPRLYRTRRWLERTTTTTTPTTTSIGVGVTASLYNDSSSSSSQQQQQQQQQQLLLAQPAQALEKRRVAVRGQELLWFHLADKDDKKDDSNRTTSVSTIPPQAATASATASFGWETQQSVDHTTRPAALQGAATVPSPRGGGNSSSRSSRHNSDTTTNNKKRVPETMPPSQQQQQEPLKAASSWLKTNGDDDVEDDLKRTFSTSTTIAGLAIRQQVPNTNTTRALDVSQHEDHNNNHNQHHDLPTKKGGVPIPHHHHRGRKQLTLSSSAAAATSWWETNKRTTGDQPDQVSAAAAPSGTTTTEPSSLSKSSSSLGPSAHKESHHQDNNNNNSHDLKTTKSGAPIILPHQQGKQLPSSTNPQQHHYYPRIPNVLLAGVQKAGTTAVSSYLKQQFGGGGGWNKDHRQRQQHPTICFPRPQRGLPHTEKEVHFFDKLYHPNHYDNDNDNPQKARAYYAKFYRHCQSTLVAPPPRTTTWQNVTLQARGNSTKTFRGTTGSIPEQSPLPPHQVPLLMDATPRYFVYPQEIYDFYRRFGLHQTLKIIIIVREPMSRELSWYHHLEYLARTRHAPPNFIAPIVRPQRQRRSLFSQKQPPSPAAKDGTNRSRSSSSSSTTTTTRTVGGGGNGGHHRVFTHRRAVSELLTFEEYVNVTLLPQLQRSSVVRAVQSNTTTTSTNGPRHFGMYAYWLEQWLTLFDRNQIWIANYDQLSSPVFLTQLHAFLELPPPRLGRGSAGARLPPHANAKHVVTTKATTTPQEKDGDEHGRPSCAVQHALFRFFEQHYNPDLYDLLDRFPPVYTAVPAAADRRRVDQHPNNNERRAVVETYPFPRFQFTCRR
ncbi:hypothetical protein ACA910_020605 [Epithemia clementina (nom. ined.)]